MINLIIHNKRKPADLLAKAIASALIEDPIEQEGLTFLLLGYHRHLNNLMRDYPNAFTDFRPTGNGEDDDGVVIY